MAALPPPRPRPPPPPPPLDLPDDLLQKILVFIPCKVDRGRIALVCRGWRAVMDRLKQHDQRKENEPPRPLPWLLLPSRFPDGAMRAACVLSACRAHHYVTVAPPGSRFFGSHDGGWLFLDFRQPRRRRRHVMLNVRTGEARLQPTVVHCLTIPGPFDMVVHAAALSAPPDHPRCVAAGIFSLAYGGSGVALWLEFSRRGGVEDMAREIWQDEPRQEDLSAEDVVYHNGAFHFITTANHIRLCSPTVDQDGHLNLGLSVRWTLRYFDPIESICDDQRIRARYLVKSREELLLVLRFTPDPTQRRTSAFKVFQATKLQKRLGFRWSWSKVEKLNGRMLFVGHGCSRSYETEQYPGFKDGIYFLDDGAFYDNSVIFGVGNIPRYYPCSDNGKWEDDRVLRCFLRTDPSDSSPPAWLLP